ncbi:MAG: hypothetical protein JNK76_11290, partial [Planctomycetales bacterium]|nr:hypothetical protein [Planctomycetales bacterium]
EQACDADDTFSAHLETTGGTIGSLYASWGGHGTATRTGEGTVFYGSRGRITGDELTLDGGTQRKLADLYAEQADPALKARHFPKGLTDSFALAQLDWLHAVEQGSQPETSGREGLADLAAAYAILESAYAGRTVSIDDVVSGRLRDFQRSLDEQFGLLGD